MSGFADPADRNVELVERFLAAFDRRWPTDEELSELLDVVRVVERPSLVSPTGSERDASALRAGIEAGRSLLAWRGYEIRDHVANGDVVVTRMRRSGELAIDAGDWPRARSGRRRRRSRRSPRSAAGAT